MVNIYLLRKGFLYGVCTLPLCFVCDRMGIYFFNDSCCLVSSLLLDIHKGHIIFNKVTNVCMSVVMPFKITYSC